jgi:hypothetical protein
MNERRSTFENVGPVSAVKVGSAANSSSRYQKTSLLVEKLKNKYFADETHLRVLRCIQSSGN